MQKYGGTIAVVSKTKLVEILEEEMQSNPLDFGLDSDYETPQIQYKEIWDTDAKSFYVLNISDEKTLTNGFRYIKELLLQTHNFRMHSDYMKLKEQNIDVYSIKTDALTINMADVDKAKELLHFGDTIGSWRVDKIGNDIRLTSVGFSTRKKQTDTHYYNPSREHSNPR